MQIAFDQNFGIASGTEAMSLGLQVRPQLQEVIDGAVEDHSHLPVGGEHGLAAGVAEIEDGKAPMP
jgi:hypothetical protein